MKRTQSVVVHDLSIDGRGVARVDGAACFIADVVPGDRAEIEIDDLARPLSGKLLTLLEPSPERVMHPCPHADLCPASPWGKLNYARQLEAKHGLVARTLRHSVDNLEILPAVPSPKQWQYRNRLALTVWAQDDQVKLGYQTGPREEIGVAVATCKLGGNNLDTLLGELSARLASLQVEGGTIPRRIQIHNTSQGAGVLLVFSRPLSDDLVQIWNNYLDGLQIPGGIWFAQGSRAGVMSNGGQIVHGPNALRMITTWIGQTIEVHPASFAQANSEAAEQVHDRLKRIAAEWEFDNVWDLYGGFGALGFALAGDARQVTVMEISPFSEVTFRELARITGNRNNRYFRGDLLQSFPNVAGKISGNDLIVLDPPRSGVHPEILRRIVNTKCRRIIYLSCNPARLARDVKILSAAGFSPVEIQPYDFFPQNPAIEVLALMER